MKKILLPLILAFSAVCFSQSIVVNDPAAPQTSFTAEELITNVLIGGGSCVQANMTFLQENPGGVTNINDRSWGYFNAAGTTFPFAEGIILSTGHAVDAEGPNNASGTTGTGAGWLGDNDLKIILDNQSGDNVGTNNATVFQFTFVPVIPNVSFDFIFASEEYEDDFECDSQFRDGFAFLLRGPGIPDDSGTPYGGTNIAAVPGSMNVPVSTLSIHADTFMCGTEIPDVNFFPQFYVSNSGANNLNEISFDGYTTSLTAQATLTPGQTYELKMVIADRGDSSFDSAVFFRAGSFDIGSVDLGLDLTASDGTARCIGESYTIVPNITAPPGTTYEWQYENPLGSGIFVPFVPAETSPNLTVTTTGRYKLIVDFAGVCTSEGDVYIEFVPPPVVNPMPDPLVVCDDDNNGLAMFTLHDADMDITMGDPNLVVRYFGTELNAINAIDELFDPYTNDDPYMDEVWARVESNMSACFEVVKLDLEVRNTPDIVVPSAPLRECDYNNPGDGFETFDLTEVEMEVLGGLDPTHYDIYYYEQEMDAVAAGDSALAMPPGDFSMAIGTPGAYQNVVAFNQTVYVLVVGNSGSVDPGTMPPSTGESCYSIVPLDLIVDPLPVVVQAAPYELCDDEVGGSTPTDQLSTFDLTSRVGEITGGNLNYQVLWFETLADEASDTPIATPGAYQNRTIAPATQPTPQTIIARVTNQFGCKRLTTLTLVVLPNPSALTPTPLEVCDDPSNDGFADFTLTDKDLEIANGETDVTVLYYQTQAEAEAGIAGTELMIPYTNDDPFTDVVWARVTRIVTPPSTSPACYSVVALDLIVNLQPDAPVSGFGDLISCDTTGGGSAVFNLEDNTPFVTGGTQLPPDYTVSYHTSFADADGGINAIINTTAYTSAGETIWVRLQENATGCGRISSFDLIVGVFPLINAPSDKAECDDQASGSDTDGVTLFDLTAYNTEITGFNPDLTVFYYETPADQAAGTAISPATSYANTSTPQTLYVSVFNSTGCEARTTLTISVLPVPVAVDPTPLVVCDDDNDGIALFDLTSKDGEITSAMGATVTYHESESDANNGVFPILSPYQNIVANVQPVWARVAFTEAPNTSGCYTVVTFDLIVNPSPLVPNSLPSLVACDQGTTSVFDLTVYESTLLDLQPVTDPPVSYSFSYHTSLANAMAGTPMITTPTMYTNTVNPQTIWIRLESGGNGCFAIVSFMLQVNTGPLANAPTPLSQCDDLGEPNDGFTIFDLTSKSDEITGGAAGVEAYYYESQQDALDDENRIVPATSYPNTSNPQTVYVRVFDTNTECESFTSLQLRVVPNPQPNTPEPIEKCDYTDAGDEKELFDLTIREGQISTNPNVVFSYHESYQQAVDNDPIAGDITMYENLENPQTIYVRVTNNASVEGCFEIVELVLVVNALPDATAQISDLVACEVDNDGFAFFNLTDRIDEILNGQDPLIHQVSFYETPGDAAAGINPIGDVTNYQNDGSVSPPGQPIYVGILNTQTTCYIASEQDVDGNYSLTFNLQVLEGVIANPITEPYVLCDQEGPNDGYTVFDLPLIGLEVLDGQPYDVDFYESLEQAQLGDTSNALPDAYTNIINPQVIYARVTHPETGCFDITDVTLKVEQLPLVVLDETYRLCVDANGNPIDAEEGGASPPVIDTGLDATLFSFEWQLDGVTLLGQNAPSIIALEGGVYTVIVTENATGCSMEVSTTVIVSSPPITYSAEVTSGAFAGSHTIEVMVTGEGDYVFQLDNGAFQGEAIFTDVDPGVHVVTIKDANGCGSVSLEVSIIDYPRFVTPNQDGYHDTWNIIGIAGGDPTAKIYIFDRFGKLLKQISPQGPGWDGTYNGNPLPSSDYWFVVEYKENDTQKEFKGHFTLKR